MICPICGAEISSLLLYKEIEGNIAYRVTEYGLMERGIDIFCEREITCETPCCQKVLDIDDNDAEDLVAGRAILLPFERLPEPFELDGSQYFVVRYKGQLFIAEFYSAHVEAFTWEDSSIGEFLLFKEVNSYHKRINELTQKRLEQIAKEVTEEDFVMPQEVEE